MVDGDSIMTTLFDRAYQLTIGPPDAPAVIIETLRVSFSITKDIHPTANPGRFQIWNLAEKTRTNLKARHDILNLSAGYVGSIGEIYEGEVIRIEHERQGPDIVTTVECVDGAEALGGSSINRNFRRNAKVIDIIAFVARQFTLDYQREPQTPLLFGRRAKPKKPSRLRLLGLDFNLPQLELDLIAQGIATTVPRGLSLSGSTRDSMNALAKTYRFEWSIQDGAIQVISVGRSVAGETVVLTEKSGLIGSPTPSADGAQWRALMSSKLAPGALATLTSDAVNGPYRIDSVRYTGDFRGDPWFAECQGRALTD